MHSHMKRHLTRGLHTYRAGAVLHMMAALQELCSRIATGV